MAAQGVEATSIKGKMESNKENLKKGADPNRFSKLSNVMCEAQAGQENNGPPVFSSPPVAHKIWTRKKRQRVEPTFIQPKIVTEEECGPIINALAKARFHADEDKQRPSDQTNSSHVQTYSEPRVFEGNIKTMLNVEMIRPNQFRFVEEPEPPDSNNYGTTEPKADDSPPAGCALDGISENMEEQEDT
ncbi:hypothetical protein SESBI_10376 [Sesbania bispinosa]|nr:hypothetical protein SESBI_10376 [Sesbania bispinosa]